MLDGDYADVRFVIDELLVELYVLFDVFVPVDVKFVVLVAVLFVVLFAVLVVFVALIIVLFVAFVTVELVEFVIFMKLVALV